MTTTDKALTREQAREHVEDEFADDHALDAALRTINAWLRRGDGMAIYRNEDFGSPNMGQRKFTSFGSEDALLEPQHLDEGGQPPTRLPDTTTDINWRYILVGTYRGEAL